MHMLIYDSSGQILKVGDNVKIEGIISSIEPNFIQNGVYGVRMELKFPFPNGSFTFVTGLTATMVTKD